MIHKNVGWLIFRGYVGMAYFHGKCTSWEAGKQWRIVAPIFRG